MESFISTHDQRCRRVFTKLLSDRAQHPKIRDQYDRYKIWAANVGANHMGLTYKKSLDYRLREAPRYRDRIVEVLNQIQNLLAEAELYLTGRAADGFSSSSDESDDDQHDSDRNGKWTLSDDDDGDADDDASKPLEKPEPSEMTSRRKPATGLEWLDSKSKLEATLASLEMAVTYLYRIPVREPATLNRLDRYHQAQGKDFDLYSHFDRLFVSDLFPNANERIVSRLGTLITLRRRILRYRESYNEELQRETEESNNTHATPIAMELMQEFPKSSQLANMDAYTEMQPSTLPKSSLKASTFRPKTHLLLDTNNIMQDASSEADEASSVATSVVEKDWLIIPPRPRNAKSEELEDFVCPYCGILKHVRSQRAWKKHVFHDLEPYGCTYEQCAEPDRMFNNRDTWFAHESQHHYTYFCGDTNHQTFLDLASFHQHMAAAHNVTLSKERNSASLEVFQRRNRRSDGQCVLCGQMTTTLKHHVGRHLERIALFSLPRYFADTEPGLVEGDNASVDNFRGSDDDTDDADSEHGLSQDSRSQQDYDANLTTAAASDVPDSTVPEFWGAVKPELSLTPVLQNTRTALNLISSIGAKLDRAYDMVTMTNNINKSSPRHGKTLDQMGLAFQILKLAHDYMRANTATILPDLAMRCLVSCDGISDTIGGTLTQFESANFPDADHEPYGILTEMQDLYILLHNFADPIIFEDKHILADMKSLLRRWANLNVQGELAPRTEMDDVENEIALKEGLLDILGDSTFGQDAIPSEDEKLRRKTRQDLKRLRKHLLTLKNSPKDEEGGTNSRPFENIPAPLKAEDSGTQHSQDKHRVESTTDGSASTSSIPETPATLPVLEQSFPDNILFRQELEYIHHNLRNQWQQHPKAGLVIVPVYGLVGAGKSRLVQNYIRYKGASSYPGGTFEIDCSSTETISRDLVNLGNAVSPDKALASELNHISMATQVFDILQKSSHWLLVMENVSSDDEIALEIARLLPDVPGAHAIIVSRDPALDGRLQVLRSKIKGRVELSGLNLVDFGRILWPGVPNEVLTVAQSTKILEAHQYTRGLPLAVFSIAKDMADRKILIEKYENRHTSDMSVRFKRAIDDLSARGHHEAVHLIRFLAFWAPAVSVKMITAGLSEVNLLFLNVQFLMRSHLVFMVRNLNDSIQILSQNGLLEREMGPSTNSDQAAPQQSFTATSSVDQLIMSPLVQAIMRDLLRMEDKDSYEFHLYKSATAFCESLDAVVKEINDWDISLPIPVPNFDEYERHGRHLLDLWKPSPHVVLFGPDIQTRLKSAPDKINTGRYRLGSILSVP